MVGEKVSHYKILERLGSGGMGVVYRALDENLCRDVAIKVLHEEVRNDPTRISMFEREAQAIAQLAHPNILAIHDFGSKDQLAFAVTELLEGETLGRRLARERLHWRKAVGVAASIADGLAAAHSKGITHRDIKPGNIFLTKDGRVKILDFGLARLGLPNIMDPMAPTATVPGIDSGNVMGTLGYMAPELLRGEAADGRSDIFALGCLLYEMLTGKHAFNRGTFALTVTAVLMDPAPEVSLSDTEASIELNRIVSRCLEKNPGERFQSASDLAFALRSLLTEKVTVVKTVMPAGNSNLALSPATDVSHTKVKDGRFIRSKTFLKIAGLVILLLCGVGAAAWLWFGTAKISLAIMPLESTNQDGLADSLTQRLSTNISDLGVVKVKPLPDRQALAAANLDLQSLAARLGARYILKGTITQKGEDLDIYIELIDGNDGSAWSHNYVARPMEITPLIADSILQRIRPNLSGTDRNRLDSIVLYGKGRNELENRNRRSLQNAIRYFDQALAKNPSYALAYAGKAESYNMLGIYGVDAPRDVFPEGIKAATQALKIDDSVAQAHMARAFAYERYEFSRQAAEEEYERAINVATNRDALGAAYHRYGVYLIGRARFREAIQNIQRAQAENPTAQIMMADEAQAYFFMGDLETAMRICNRTIDKHPSFAPAYRYRGWVNEQRGNFAKAIDDFKTALTLSGESPLMKAELGHVLASAGMKEDATLVLVELEKARSTGYSSCYKIAQIQICLGRQEVALNYLEQAFAESDPHLWILAIDPIFSKRLGDEPRFKELKKRFARHAP